MLGHEVLVKAGADWPAFRHAPRARRVGEGEVSKRLIGPAELAA